VPTPSYPNFAGKHAGQALFTAADFVAYQRQVGALDDREVPGGAVLCYQPALYDHVLRAEGLKLPRRRDLPLPLPSTGGRVGLVGRFGIGAPGATSVLEEVAALGTSAMVSIGTAGSLQRDLAPGDLVLCEAAVRDEGVSHHYLPPGRLATAPAEMTAALGTALGESGLAFRPGVSWTIDTPYRETVAEARHYQAEGVLCVEMEAAALFAVAEVRGLRLASAFVISDSLADLVWNPRFHDPAVQAGLLGLYQAAVSALMGSG
jgi:uridine phosphorylase